MTMTQRKSISTCKEAGLRLERSSLAVAIKRRQKKHKSVAGLQARLATITNKILRLELGK